MIKKLVRVATISPELLRTTSPIEFIENGSKGSKIKMDYQNDNTLEIFSKDYTNLCENCITEYYNKDTLDTISEKDLDFSKSGMKEALEGSEDGH